MRNFLIRSSAIALLISFSALAQNHTLNLKDADLQTLIATVAEITGKSFVIDPRTKGQDVTVISSTAMTADEIYSVFLSVLKIHGFSAVESGDIIRIVSDINAKQDTIDTGNADLDSFSADDMVTRIIQVDHLKAAELVPILNPLIPQSSHLVSHAASNVLIISDRAGNVDRLLSIIKRVDKASDENIEVIPLNYANAAEVVRIISSFSRGGTANNAAPNVIADARTNTVLLGGDRASRVQLRTLISHLDTPLESEDNISVIYLRYSDAESLIPILEGVASTLDESISADGKNGKTTIQAHTATNSLIISTSPSIFRSLKSIVRQLDVRRAQVLVEAIIAEVSLEVAEEIGIQWQAIGDYAGGTSFGSGSSNISNLAGSIAGIATGAATSTILGQGLTLGFLDGTTTRTLANGDTVEVPYLAGVLRALNSDADTNILSTPSIVTLDHQEAQIQVGQEVPFITGSFTNTGANNGSASPFQTIQREDVGITLIVTPHINEGNTIMLEIDQEVSSLVSSANTGVTASDLITSKKKLTTTVMVEDNSMLILGGLIDEDVQETISKVPGLGDIPIIGNLFKYRNTSRRKRNLMIFLHTRILKDAATTREITGGKYNFMRNAQQLKIDQSKTRSTKQALPLLPAMFDGLEPVGINGLKQTDSTEEQ